MPGNRRNDDSQCIVLAKRNWGSQIEARSLYFANALCSKFSNNSATSRKALCNRRQAIPAPSIHRLLHPRTYITRKHPGSLSIHLLAIYRRAVGDRRQCGAKLSANALTFFVNALTPRREPALNGGSGSFPEHTTNIAAMATSLCISMRMWSS
jgi:hypothetical protein